MADGPFIAIDWGTTNCRACRVERGTAQQVVRLDAGVAGLAAQDYPQIVARLRADLGDLPVLAAGMLGSTRGWIVAPYVPVPASLGDLAAACVAAPAQAMWIVPGVAQDRPGACDVMRGEEVQFLGAAIAHPDAASAAMVQPGTHSKWAEVDAGRITRFSTWMTGELFALLRVQSTLAEMLAAPPALSPAFFSGLKAAEGHLLHSLFAVRASVLLEREAAADGASFVSGLLIGQELRGNLKPGQRVGIVAEGDLAKTYEAAIGACGGVPVCIDGTAAFVTGMTSIWSMMTR